MSFSNPKAENPVKVFIEYKGDSGKFFFYDKLKEENIEVPTPFKFIVLDELNTISGFSEKYNAGLYSNEVSDITKETLNVRAFKKNLSIIGKYKDIKDTIVANGGKFTKSVYAIILKSENKYVMVNFKFKGSSFGGCEVDGKFTGGWMNKKFNPETFGVTINSFLDAKKGATKYKVPVFESFEINEQQRQLAIEADLILQEYLKSYKANQLIQEVPHTDEAEEVVNAIQEKESILYKSEDEPEHAGRERAKEIEESDLPF